MLVAVMLWENTMIVWDFSSSSLRQKQINQEVVYVKVVRP